MKDQHTKQNMQEGFVRLAAPINVGRKIDCY